jgi:transcriptional regulator with XRE-family HTH domain
MADEIRRHREARGLSAQQLADRCAELGLEISRSTLADLENDRRVTLSVAELLVFGRALQVPALLLLFPLGQAEEVESLPGVQEDTWTAAKRFIGENGPDAPGVADLFRDHEHYLRRFLESYRDVVKMQRAGLQEANQRYEDMRRDDLPPLRRIRQIMRAQGLTPPPLPGGIPGYFGLDLDEADQ